MLKWLRPPEAVDAGGGAPEAPSSRSPSRLFHYWPRDRKPDVVLFLSGEDHGYIQPCGCSKPQYGGFERRYNFLQNLIKDRGWPVVAVDLGDIAQRSGPQSMLKYVYSMEALRRMSYLAVGIGRYEMALPLIDALGEYALNNPSPRVLAANLVDKDQSFSSMNMRTSEVSKQDGSPKVGVIAVVAPSVAQEVRDPMVKFVDINKTLPAELKKLEAEKPDIRILLFEGSLEEAKNCASKFPHFQVVLCLSKEEEPPEKPDKVGDTLVISVGQKGREIGLVGAYRTENVQSPFEMHYQLVQLGPEYETLPGKDNSNPILAILEGYAKKVRDDNYLARYSKVLHPVQLEKEYKDATFVGSDACKKCHKEAFQIWKDSPHSHAYHSLEQAQRPSLRQYDGECIVCHVTGFGFRGGFTNEKETPLLKENGCENCHGPGSLHAKGNTDEKLLKLMNPFKTLPNENPEQKANRINALDRSCQKCHDEDNDVHWKIEKWVKGKIIHNELK